MADELTQVLLSAESLHRLVQVEVAQFLLILASAS
jgi:hypothetical protein